MLDLRQYSTLHVVQDGETVLLLAENKNGVIEKLPLADRGSIEQLTSTVFARDAGAVVEIESARFRRVSFPTTHGQSATLVPIDRDLIPLTAYDITGKQLAMLRDLSKRTGLVLVLGLPRTGKTNTVAALMQTWMESNPGRGYEVADPAEIRLPLQIGNSYFTSTTIPPDGYQKAVIELKQAAPKYVGFGEVRHASTAIAVTELAQAGPLCVTNFNTDSVLSGLSAFIAMASQADQYAAARLAMSLTAIIQVKLDRSLEKPRGSLFAWILKSDISDAVRNIIRDGRISSLNQSLETAEKDWARAQ